MEEIVVMCLSSKGSINSIFTPLFAWCVSQHKIWFHQNSRFILAGTTHLQGKQRAFTIQFIPLRFILTRVDANKTDICLVKAKETSGTSWENPLILSRVTVLPNIQWVNQHLNQQHLPELESKTKLRNRWSGTMSHMESEADALPL